MNFLNKYKRKELQGIETKEMIKIMLKQFIKVVYI